MFAAGSHQCSTTRLANKNAVLWVCSSTNRGEIAKSANFNFCHLTDSFCKIKLGGAFFPYQPENSAKTRPIPAPVFLGSFFMICTRCPAVTKLQSSAWWIGWFCWENLLWQLGVESGSKFWDMMGRLGTFGRHAPAKWHEQCAHVWIYKNHHLRRQISAAKNQCFLWNFSPGWETCTWWRIPQTWEHLASRPQPPDCLDGFLAVSSKQYCF